MLLPRYTMKECILYLIIYMGIYNSEHRVPFLENQKIKGETFESVKHFLRAPLLNHLG